VRTQPELYFPAAFGRFAADARRRAGGKSDSSMISDS
jgi:hypothetical protein